jgi:hypothetical protein
MERRKMKMEVNATEASTSKRTAKLMSIISRPGGFKGDWN